ncbi:hypothetical protein PINS_up006171 [Pythium insidiosum]|nr:hypothetical protein PINS_up006171 [Pythium insidiosum]
MIWYSVYFFGGVPMPSTVDASAANTAPYRDVNGRRRHRRRLLDSTTKPTTQPQRKTNLWTKITAKVKGSKSKRSKNTSQGDDDNTNTKTATLTLPVDSRATTDAKTTTTTKTMVEANTKTEPDARVTVKRQSVYEVASAAAVGHAGDDSDENESSALQPYFPEPERQLHIQLQLPVERQAHGQEQGQEQEPPQTQQQVVSQSRVCLTDVLKQARAARLLAEERLLATEADFESLRWHKQMKTMQERSYALVQQSPLSVCATLASCPATVKSLSTEDSCALGLRGRYRTSSDDSSATASTQVSDDDSDSDSDSCSLDTESTVDSLSVVHKAIDAEAASSDVDGDDGEDGACDAQDDGAPVDHVLDDCACDIECTCPNVTAVAMLQDGDMVIDVDYENTGAVDAQDNYDNDDDDDDCQDDDYEEDVWDDCEWDSSELLRAFFLLRAIRSKHGIYTDVSMNVCSDIDVDTTKSDNKSDGVDDNDSVYDDSDCLCWRELHDIGIDIEIEIDGDADDWRDANASDVDDGCMCDIKCTCASDFGDVEAVQIEDDDTECVVGGGDECACDIECVCSRVAAITSSVKSSSDGEMKNYNHDDEDDGDDDDDDEDDWDDCDWDSDFLRASLLFHVIRSRSGVTTAA